MKSFYAIGFLILLTTQNVFAGDSENTIPLSSDISLYCTDVAKIQIVADAFQDMQTQSDKLLSATPKALRTEKSRVSLLVEAYSSDKSIHIHFQLGQILHGNTYDIAINALRDHLITRTERRIFIGSSDCVLSK